MINAQCDVERASRICRWAIIGLIPRESTSHPSYMCQRPADVSCDGGKVRQLRGTIADMTLLLVLSTCAVIITLSSSGCGTEPSPPPNNGADTTSHDFVWHMETLGDGNASVLNDVFIVDDDYVIAVGEINVQDSVGNWEPPYGVAIWDGQSWSLKRILAWWPGTGSSNVRPTGVFAFSRTDIWFAYSGVFHWDGVTVTPYWIGWDYPGNPNFVLDSGQTADKLWGTSSSDLYAVGRRGGMAHFDGSRWTKLESGTTLDVKDIWGGVNSKTRLRETIAVAAILYSTYDRKILGVWQNTVVTLSDSGISLPLDGVWFDPGRHYWVVGSGIYEKNDIQDISWDSEVPVISTFHTYAVRGNAWNDVFVVGSYGEVVHYNGASWKSYRDVTRIVAGGYYAVAVKGNLMFAVGLENPRGAVLMGRR